MRSPKIAGGIGLLVMIALVPSMAQETAPPPSAEVLSILDFEDHIGDEETAWLSAGLADMLITDLAPADIVVVDRSDIEAVLDEQTLALTGLTDDQALTVGQLVSADYILKGFFASSAGTLRIDARIVAVDTGAVESTATVTGRTGDLLTLEAALAREICVAFGVSPPVELGRPGTASLPAAKAYYEGLQLQSSGEIEAARARFEEAAHLDPLYIKPRLSLEESWKLLSDFRNMRKQREMNALWIKAEALKVRLAAEPFVGDTELIMNAYTAGSPTVQIGSPPADDPTLGSCPSPPVCLWNLQMTYWEIGWQAEQEMDDPETALACRIEVLRLADEAETVWLDDPWFPEIFYQTLLARRFLPDWEGLKTGCERMFLEWPDFRMMYAVEDFYEAALEALGEIEN